MNRLTYVYQTIKRIITIVSALFLNITRFMWIHGLLVFQLLLVLREQLAETQIVEHVRFPLIQRTPPRHVSSVRLEKRCARVFHRATVVFLLHLMTPATNSLLEQARFVRRAQRAPFV